MITRSAVLVPIGLALVLGLAACSATSNASAPSSSASAATSGEPAAQVALDTEYMTAVGGALAGQSKTAVIALGLRTCGAFSEGSTATDIRNILEQKGLDEAQASRVILAAAAIYCPEFKKLANP
jgi:hypothetical protein